MLRGILRSEQVHRESIVPEYLLYVAPLPEQKPKKTDLQSRLSDPWQKAVHCCVIKPERTNQDELIYALADCIDRDLMAQSHRLDKSEAGWPNYLSYSLDFFNVDCLRDNPCSPQPNDFHFNLLNPKYYAHHMARGKNGEPLSLIACVRDWLLSEEGQTYFWEPNQQWFKEDESPDGEHQVDFGYPVPSLAEQVRVAAHVPSVFRNDLGQMTVSY